MSPAGYIFVSATRVVRLAYWRKFEADRARVERNYAPAHMLCPKCGTRMRLAAIEQSVSVLDADDIIISVQLQSQRKAHP
jgi:hypothetical protein